MTRRKPADTARQPRKYDLNEDSKNTADERHLGDHQQADEFLEELGNELLAAGVAVQTSAKVDSAQASAASSPAAKAKKVETPPNPSSIEEQLQQMMQFMMETDRKRSHEAEEMRKEQNLQKQQIADLIARIDGHERQFAARKKELEAKQVELEKREQALLQRELSFVKAKATCAKKTQQSEQQETKQVAEKQQTTYHATVEDAPEEHEEQKLHHTFFDPAALFQNILSVTTPIDPAGSQYLFYLCTPSSPKSLRKPPFPRPQPPTSQQRSQPC